jgi:membrane fusion protein (multidrug efflux system)
MKKSMLTMLCYVGLLILLVLGMKGCKQHMINERLTAFRSPIITVSAAKVASIQWQPQYQSSGSLRATLGVNVTTETAGMVRTIAFKPGSMVKKGDLLVQLDIDSLNAQLQSYQASANLAKVTYNRDKAQYAIHAISKATLDTDLANVQTSVAQVNLQVATIAKSTITAPFAGRVGICNVNPGQYLNPGDSVTSLETLDPIYADFYVPQSVLPRLKANQKVEINSDAFAKQKFSGFISTIDSSFNSSSRNTEIEATIANPDHSLIPGMYASLTVETGNSEARLTLPQAAVTFNSYGSLVYRLIPTTDKDPKTEKPLYTISQAFITTGETRGDQITILSGVHEGDLVVTSGQLKLKNNSKVIINDQVVPADNAVPSESSMTNK